MDTTSLTTDVLREQLLDREAVVACARGEQMAVLRELDRRQISAAEGCRSMVEWVSRVTST